MTALLRFLSGLLASPRIIMDRVSGTPYLARWYLIGRRPTTDRHGNPIAPGTRSRRCVEVYLHRFFRSDHDGELHSHPWRWAIAIIFAGGYREERRVGDAVRTFVRRPGDIVFLRGEDFHRVDLLGTESWSLFIVGPKASSWAFWDRETRRRAHWRAFLAWKQEGAAEPAWTRDERGTP